MASLKTAAQCIGITPPFSVVHDFFGFFTGRPAGMTVSVGRQVGLLKGRHLHLNAIATGPMQPNELAHIDQAVQVARDFFAPGGIGIGRVRHFDLGAGGYEIIVDSGVAYNLWDSHSAPGDGLDAFFCYRISGEPSGMAPGWPYGAGSCDKSDKDSGIAVAVLDNPGTMLGWALAHEMGHFMDLDHEDELPTNIMTPVMPGKESDRAVGGFYAKQFGIMKGHCLMRAGCPN